MNTEQKVVLTDNELIAEFMGAIKKRDVHEGLPCMLISGGGAPVSGWYYNANELEYGKRWDWLMPVVEKINNLSDFPYLALHIYHDRIFLHRTREEEVLDYYRHGGTDGPMIAAVYKAVVDFIKWYNTQKTTE